MNNDPAPTYQTVTQPGRVSVLEAESPQFEFALSDQFTFSADRTFTLQALNPVSVSLWSLAAGDFSFHNNGQEMLRFSAAGDIYVRGELMETNRDVVDGLKRMLGIAPVKTLSGDLMGEYPQPLPAIPTITIPDLGDFDYLRFAPLTHGKPLSTYTEIQIDPPTGATCACGAYNEYQTDPYTCYSCRNHG